MVEVELDAQADETRAVVTRCVLTSAVCTGPVRGIHLRLVPGDTREIVLSRELAAQTALQFTVAHAPYIV
jgi:hypothetical protein